MKTIVLFMLLATLGVIACKKEKNNSSRLDKPIGEAIRGVWFTTSETHEYFNSNNQKVFTRTVEPGWEYSISELFKITNPQGQRLLRTEYAISNTNGKNYISFSNNGMTETYEITSLEQETMSWKQEKTNVTYNDNGEKTAAKEISILNFQCPCK